MRKFPVLLFLLLIKYSRQTKYSAVITVSAAKYNSPSVFYFIMTKTGNDLLHILSEYLLTSVSNMKCIFTILLFVTFPQPQYISTLSYKRQNIRKMLLDITYVFRFSLQSLSTALLILRRNGKYMFINEY